MQRPNQNESAYGDFEYRWNYEEYQKSLQKQRRRASGSGMQAFFLTTAFVFLICFSSLVMVLGAAFLRGNVSIPSAEDVSDMQQVPKAQTYKEEKNALEMAAEVERPTETVQSTERIEPIYVTPPMMVSDDGMENLLGILGESVTQADAQRFRLPTGIRIMNVYEDQMADRVGLRRDDILLAIENMRITTLAELAALEDTFSPGKNISVRIFRGGEELSFEFIVDTDIAS